MECTDIFWHEFYKGAGITLYAGAVAAPAPGLRRHNADRLPAAAPPRGGDAGGPAARGPGPGVALPCHPRRSRVTAMSDAWRVFLNSPLGAGLNQSA
jgi:hypothetical protein